MRIRMAVHYDQRVKLVVKATQRSAQRDMSFPHRQNCIFVTERAQVHGKFQPVPTLLNPMSSSSYISSKTGASS